uniref:Uncharacterized protein n=1 Tax=Cacopsylla melanoneura TaxID=428564 RepID=A0A8D8QBK8_9HEMI
MVNVFSFMFVIFHVELLKKNCKLLSVGLSLLNILFVREERLKMSKICEFLKTNFSNVTIKSKLVSKGGIKTMINPEEMFKTLSTGQKKIQYDSRIGGLIWVNAPHNF